MNKSYYERKKSLRTRSTKPTLTDQSQAQGTDINVVIGHMLATGQPPGEATPVYGDFTELPEDLRGFIERSRSLKNLHGKLPPQLKSLSLMELLKLTPDQLTQILKPADIPQNKTEEPQQ